MGSLPTQGYLPLTGVEGNTPLNQVSYPLGAFPGQNIYRFMVTQTGPGSQGVAHVQSWGVPGTNGGGDAPLSVAGVAVVDLSFGDNQHRSVLLGQQRSVETGNSAADNNVVVVGISHVSKY